MSELEKFLQQAAERMKERLQEQQAAQQRTQRRPAQPVRQVERAAPSYDDEEILDAELGEASVSSFPQRRTSAPQRMASMEPSAEPPRATQPQTGAATSGSFRQRAEERMNERLHQTFDHAIGQLNQRSTSAVTSPTNFGSPGQTGLSSEVDRRVKETSPLVQVLRERDSLKAAFIVGEIFKRKF
jgi:hypothetical protein